jgi:hypothetical protein
VNGIKDAVFTYISESVWGYNVSLIFVWCTHYENKVLVKHQHLERMPPQTVDEIKA